MSSASPKPMWLRMARCAFAWFASVYVVSSASVLVLVIHRYTCIYRQTLARLSLDCRAEYEEHSGDAATMRALFAETAEEHGHGNVFLLVTDSNGGVVVEEASNADISRAMRDFVPDPGRTCRVTAEEERPGLDTIAVRVRKTVLSDGRVLLVGVNVTENERVSIGVMIVLTSALIAVLAASLVLSVALSRRFTAPLGRIASAARDIAAGDYSAHVPVTDEGREIAELEEAFNTMGAENERTLNELRRLMDDIAHDMRTPLTRLRAAAEVSAMKGEGGALPETVIEETSSMLGLINTSLAVSQAENLGCTAPLEEIDFTTFARQMCDLYAVSAEDAGIEMSSALPGKPVFVMAHRGQLQQLVGNLLDNAVKFTPAGGYIRVSIGDSPVVLEVENTGPGIDESDIPHVFSRFWRAQKSRSLPGNGLGLALVKAIAESYGGSVSCTSSPSGPTKFTVRFAS